MGLSVTTHRHQLSSYGDWAVFRAGFDARKIRFLSQGILWDVRGMSTGEVRFNLTWHASAWWVFTQAIESQGIATWTTGREQKAEVVGAQQLTQTVQVIEQFFVIPWEHRRFVYLSAEFGNYCHHNAPDPIMHLSHKSGDWLRKTGDRIHYYQLEWIALAVHLVVLAHYTGEIRMHLTLESGAPLCWLRFEEEVGEAWQIKHVKNGHRFQLSNPAAVTKALTIILENYEVTDQRELLEHFLESGTWRKN